MFIESVLLLLLNLYDERSSSASQPASQLDIQLET